MKSFKVKNANRTMLVTREKSAYRKVSFYIENRVSECEYESLSINLLGNDLKELISKLIEVSDFKVDDFKEKYYRYESPEFFGYSSSQTRFLYQNIIEGNIFLESEEKFGSFINKDNYKNTFTDKEFEELLESNPELSVLIKDKKFNY